MMNALVELDALADRTNAEVLNRDVALQCGWKADHCREVGRCVALGLVELGVAPDEAALYALGGFVHDGGITEAPGIIDLINAPRRLDDSERRCVGQHALLGRLKAQRTLVASSAEEQQAIEVAAFVIGGHHTPLPQLAAYSAPWHAIEVTAATQMTDMMHALTDPRRPYRNPLPIEEAVHEVEQEFHGAVVFGATAAEYLGAMQKVMPPIMAADHPVLAA